MACPGKDHRDHPVPSPLPRAGDLSLEQVGQKPIQTDHELFQGGGIHSFSRHLSVPQQHHRE